MHRKCVCLTTLLVFAILFPCPASAGEKEKSKAFTNSVGMKLVSIPAGEFMMGSNKSAAEIAKQIDSKQTPFRELRRHAVRLSRGFYMSTTEVTQDQFTKAMGTTP